MIARAMLALCLACSLAACAGAAQQEATTTDPKPRPYVRKADPLPPERMEDNRCAVDDDCATKPACADADCRCVQERCIRGAPAIDPAVDPVPAPPASI